MPNSNGFDAAPRFSSRSPARRRSCSLQRPPSTLRPHSDPSASASSDGFEHALVVFGHDFDEFGRVRLPQRQDLPGTFTVGILGVALEHLLDFQHIAGVQGLQGHRFRIAPAVETARPRPARRRRRRTYPRQNCARSAEDHHAATGHILTAVVTDAFDHRAARRYCARRSARQPCRGYRLRRWWRHKTPRCRQ